MVYFLIINIFLSIFFKIKLLETAKFKNSKFEKESFLQSCFEVSLMSLYFLVFSIGVIVLSLSFLITSKHIMGQAMVEAQIDFLRSLLLFF